ncbi:PH domain-containing protein [Flavobacterium zhairuonense]|uniref:PH domain-containing protein n=1 Tax=Flavobacterium zhairuonense TaxID=2493631 RepID=UPI001045FF73|nr:PH domain-containing protein [Flavobacterium zhairuonense]KAF2512763.1 PH domain-containing protein [Flavobacterium zhairuonense]
MVKFKSKIDIWLVLFLSLVLGGALINALYNKVWGASIVLGIIIVFIVHMFLNTFYTIEEGKLKIKCGFLINSTVYTQKIKKISETNSIMSSPALSFDRLEIVYNKFDTVIISPKDKNGFFEAIKKINPEVEIVLKNKKN